MITITESAQEYLAELLLKQDDALGVRVFINQPGTPRAETCIAYCREGDLQDEDDVVEIFIRANAGGTKLGKSDLLFSLLTSAWEDADERMDELLDNLNKSGYDFTRDFVLKTHCPKYIQIIHV